MNKDVLIIGGGIAGLTAALYAQRAGLSSVVFEKNVCGGQIVQSAEVENYPGLPSVDGPTLATAVWEQACGHGAEVIFDEAAAISLDGQDKSITTSSGDTYHGKAIIWAGGVKRRLLGCEGEDRFTGKGVSYCATCDGAFFKGKTVAVVGGGNTALEDALVLAKLCEKVYLIHRRDTFRGEAVLAEAVKKQSNIELVLNAQVKKISGEGKVSSIDVSFTDGGSRSIEVSGVFVAIGLIPDTKLLEGIIELDDAGYIPAGEEGVTSIPGFFVAGDCRTKKLRQLITAASDGANAAQSALEYLRSI